MCLLGMYLDAARQSAPAWKVLQQIYIWWYVMRKFQWEFNLGNATGVCPDASANPAASNAVR